MSVKHLRDNNKNCGVFVVSSEPEHELFLVYGKGRPGVIRGMDLHARVYDEHIIPIENLNNPRALDFHTETEFIYFSDATTYTIGRQKIDGTERDIIVKDGEARNSTLHTGRALFIYNTIVIIEPSTSNS